MIFFSSVLTVLLRYVCPAIWTSM